jgi:hypothetical protein
MMDIAVLSVGVFGVSSLATAFIKCTIAKRKAAQIRDHTKNPLRRF